MWYNVVGCKKNGIQDKFFLGRRGICVVRLLQMQARPGLEGRLVKNCIRAIFYHEFSAKTHLFFILTKDAPRWKLRCVNPWRCLFASKNGKMFFY